MISTDQKNCNRKRVGKRGKWSRRDYTPEEMAYIKFMGLKIRKRRLQLGMTQSDIGELIFTTFQQVQKYEKGTNVINNIKLERLRQALNIPSNRIGFLMNKYNRKDIKDGNQNYKTIQTY